MSDLIEACKAGDKYRAYASLSIFSTDEIFAVDNAGNNALYYALLNKLPYIAEFLLKRKVPAPQFIREKCIFNWCIVNREMHSLLTYLLREPYIHQKNQNGATTLYTACKYGRIYLAHDLLTLGVVDVPFHGKSALTVLPKVFHSNDIFKRLSDQK